MKMGAPLLLCRKKQWENHGRLWGVIKKRGKRKC